MPPCTRFGSTSIRKTEGNPLFLEESVRSLVDAGSLIGERGAYRQAGPIDAIRVPDTVQTVLSARIDRLDPETKRLLQLAAVIGKDVPFALLRAIVEMPDEALHGALSRILATELMYEAHLLPELVYTFKHALTHEVAYGSLLQDRRRAAPRPHRGGAWRPPPATMDAARTSSPSRPTGSGITRCGASSGSRPSPICGGPVCAMAPAPRIGRPPHPSSRRSTR